MLNNEYHKKQGKIFYTYSWIVDMYWLYPTSKNTFRGIKTNWCGLETATQTLPAAGRHSETYHFPLGGIQTNWITTK
jgi:hypothetical protein